jgi:hypothetical protein
MSILLPCRRTEPSVRRLWYSRCSESHSSHFSRDPVRDWLCREGPGLIDGCHSVREGDQPSPPISISPLPSHFGHRPLPPHEGQEVSPLSPPDARRKFSVPILPLPRHAEQFPSPGESQSMQIWADMARLPPNSAILIAFHAHVNCNKSPKQIYI